METIWRLATSLLLIVAGCTKCSPESMVVAVASVEDQAVREPLVCTITSEPTCKMGEVPNIAVAVINQTNADIYLVGSLDASDCKWRYPHCYFKIIGPDGKSPVEGIGRCGNMNTLREKDFIRVSPGKTFDPYQDIDGYGFFSAHQISADTFRAVGEYRIQFFYSTKSDDIAEWAGDDRAKVAADERLLGLFRQVPKVEVNSNEIKITVVEPSATTE